MKKSRKNFIITAVIFSILVGVSAFPVKTYAKGNYWLFGVSKPAGGDMEMYFNGNKITLDGKIKKASSEKKVYNAKEKNGPYKLKISKTCKVINVEAENVEVIPFKKWIKNNGYKSGNEISFISVVIKVFNKKIKSITFSA